MPTPNVVITQDPPVKQVGVPDILPPISNPLSETADQATEAALRAMGFLGESDTLISTPGSVQTGAGSTSNLPTGGSTPAPAPPPTPPPSATPPPDPNAPPAPAAPPPEPPKKRRRKIDDLTDQVGQLNERLTKGPPAPPLPPPPPPKPPLTGEAAVQAEEDRALEHLAATSAAYAGRDLKGEMEKWRKRLEDYQGKWEELHPGEAFDIKGDEHEQFYERYYPDIEDRDVIVAQAELRGRAAADEQYRAQMARVHAKNRTQEADASGRTAISHLVGAMDPKFKGKSIAEVEKEDPFLAEALEGVEQLAANRARMAVLLFHPEMPIQFDQNNPEHNFMAKAVAEFEKEFEAMPPQQSMYQGRQFAPIQQYANLPPDQRDNYWTLYAEPTLIRHLILADVAIDVRDRADRMRTRFGKIAAPATAAAAAAAAPPSPPPPAPAGPVNPPSAGGSGVASPTPQAGTRTNPFDTSHFFN